MRHDICKNLLGYTELQYKSYIKNFWSVFLEFSIRYCFLYCGRQNLSYVLPTTMSGEGWTALQLGVLSSIPFCTYALGHLVNGRLGEIVGLNKLIVIGIVLSAVMNLAIGFQSSLILISILWGINGFVAIAFAKPGIVASMLLFFAGFFIYGINSLVWVFATDIGGRTFGSTASGILDFAAYMGASGRAIYFGSVLTNGGSWSLVFIGIISVLAVMVMAVLLAGRKKAKGDEDAYTKY